MKPPNQLNIPIDQTTPVHCEACGNSTFTQGFYLRKAPRLLTGNPTDGYIPIPTFACLACGHVNEEFAPKEQPAL